MKRPLLTHYRHSNWIKMAYLMGFFAIFPIVGVVALFNASFELWKVLLGNVLVWYLYIEMGMNIYCRITVDHGTITVSRPWRKYSLLTRKRLQVLVIPSDSWDKLFTKNFKGGNIFYFQKEGKLAYLFSVDGFTFVGNDLGACFPDKLIRAYHDALPIANIRAFKKAHPDRVL